MLAEAGVIVLLSSGLALVIFWWIMADCDEKYDICDFCNLPTKVDYLYKRDSKFICFECLNEEPSKDENISWNGDE